MRRFILITGSLAIVMVSFFCTIYFLDSKNFQPFDEIRVEHAKSLKAALEKYRAVHGKYPAPFVDNDTADLKRTLVDGGFIAKLPVDPYWKNGRINQYRYRSDGSSYALLFYLELGPCLTGVGPYTTAPWDGRKITTCAF